MSKAHSQIELKIQCIDLVNLRNNVQVYLLIKDQKTQEWINLSCTEVIGNDPNPKFVKGMIVDYYFEELQELRFVVVNVSKPKQTDWRNHELIGQFEYDLGSLMGNPGRKIIEKLCDPKRPERKRGCIIISGEEFVQSKRVVRLQFQANHVEFVGFMRFFKKKPDLYFTVSRANEDNTFSPVYESNSIISGSPCWPMFEIPENTLCNVDNDRTLLIEVKNKRKSPNPVYGSCTLTLTELLSDVKTFRLQTPPSVRINSRASLRVLNIVRDEHTTFLDYIAGGIQINLVVAIDFTASNGDHRKFDSLHYFSPNEENSYQKAISSVGRILAAYDYDKKFPVYGFGAKFNGVLSHVYPLNGNFQDPEVSGIDGILDVYSQTMKSVELYGPTNFSPIISHTATKIKSELAAGNDKVYYILLIITDGVITDMDSTVRAIIKASQLPLSIVIVGVGDADFSKMHILDADDVPLISNGEQMESDIVQFVAMRDFQTEYSKYLLPKAVLEEIPDQFLSYMKRKGIPPNPPINAKLVELIENSRDSNFGNGSGINKNVANSKHASNSNANNNYNDISLSDIPPEYTYN